MKQVIVVSKTHLDLGFTDYAENIEKKYLENYIPSAIEIAKKLNTDKKRFVWTTGSWLIDKALQSGTAEQRKNVEDALRNGDIVAHALPFTTHSELMSKELMEYGLSIIDRIDSITGKKTISAKMTDVPGHTKAIVPYLCKKGIKLLHIGVNYASTVPSVPPCFLWKNGESEIVVIYSSSGYGGEFRSEYLDDVLYLDHTADNRGTVSAKETLKRFEKIEKRFKGYEVVAGSLDDYAEKIWQVKDKLPVVCGEIGDTWIHGVGTDFEKVAVFREFEKLVSEWLKKGELVVGSKEYEQVMNNLLCIAEHTWGYDVKVSLADYTNYLREDFEKARANDDVGTRNLVKWLLKSIYSPVNKGKSYSRIEKSWQEQRDYLKKAADALSTDKAIELKARTDKLINVNIPKISNDNLVINKRYKNGSVELEVNEYGGIGYLSVNGKTAIVQNDKPFVTYRSYGNDDYVAFNKTYNRNMNSTWYWAMPDFGRPLLKMVDKKFPKGEFFYVKNKGEVFDDGVTITIAVECVIDEKCFAKLGTPKKVYVIYKLQDDGLIVEVCFKDKPANRLSESLQVKFMVNVEDGLTYYKIGEKIDPYDVVENGNRNLSSVEKVEYDGDDGRFTINNVHASLVAMGNVNILDFRNEYGDINADGLSFILSNNVWGTNFPLWQEGDGYFKFEIK